MSTGRICLWAAFDPTFFSHKGWLHWFSIDMRDKQQIAFTSSLSLSIYPALCPIQPSIVFRCVLLKSSYIAPLCQCSAVMWVWWRKAYSLNSLTHTVFKRLRWPCVYIMNPREDLPSVWSTALSFKLFKAEHQVQDLDRLREMRRVLPFKSCIQSKLVRDVQSWLFVIEKNLFFSLSLWKADNQCCWGKRELKYGSH